MLGATIRETGRILWGRKRSGKAGPGFGDDSEYAASTLWFVLSSYLKKVQQQLVVKDAPMVRDALGSDMLGVLKNLQLEKPSHALLFLEHLNGTPYSTVGEWMAASFPSTKIGNTHKPFVVLYADDDPYIPIHGGDVRGVEEDPNTCLVLFNGGGHCAFLSNMFPAANFIDKVQVQCSDVVTRLDQVF